MGGIAIEESLKCLNPCGRFIEIGKRDILEGSNVNLNRFLQNITYFSCHLDLLSENMNILVLDYMKKCLDLYRNNVLHPIETICHQSTSLGKVLKNMSLGRHTGKQIIEIVDETIDENTLS